MRKTMPDARIEVKTIKSIVGFSNLSFSLKVAAFLSFLFFGREVHT